MRRTPGAAVAFVAMIVAIATTGCGGSASSASTTTNTTSSPATTPASTAGSTTSVAPRRRRPRPRGAPVGSTQRVHAGTSILAVTVSRVLDPLQDSGAALVPGTRPVGVMVEIRNEAGATYDSTASGDWSVQTSVGTASPAFIKRGVCQTPLVDFESLIGVGETRSGCIGFGVARGARIVSVRFSPHSRAPGTVNWR
jgi:hypothetical protein